MKIDTQDECSIATIKKSFAVEDICYKWHFVIAGLVINFFREEKHALSIGRIHLWQ